MTTRSVAAVAAAVCALSLAACSSSSTDSKDSKDAGKSAASSSSSSKSTPPPAAKDVWNKAQDTLGTYKSVELKFDGTFEGMSDMDVKGEVDGDPQEVSGSMDGGRINYLTTNAKTYIKADAPVWSKMGGSLPASVTAKMANQWLQMPEPEASMKGIVSGMLSSLRDDAQSKEMLDGKATITSDTLDGKDVWKIVDSNKKGIAWVTKDERHDLLKIEGPDTSAGAAAGATMKMTVVSHDKDYGLKVPAGAKSLADIAK